MRTIVVCMDYGEPTTEHIKSVQICVGFGEQQQMHQSSHQLNIVFVRMASLRHISAIVPGCFVGTRHIQFSNKYERVLKKYKK